MHVWPVPVAKAVLGADAHRVGMLCGQDQEEEEKEYAFESMELLDHVVKAEQWAEADTANNAQDASSVGCWPQPDTTVCVAEIEATELWKRCWGTAKVVGISNQRYVYRVAGMLACVGECEPPQTLHLRV